MIRAGLRRAVRGTRGIWPLGNLYRGLYRTGLGAFATAVTRFQEVRSIYLRGSLAVGEWLPGDSDIDLTVVIDDMEAEAEAVFLKRFWKSQRLLERLFPFIPGQDIALLTTKELAQADLAQKRFAPLPEASIGRWKLLRGTEHRSREYAPADRISLLRHLKFLYCSLFSKFLTEPSLERASEREYRRIAAKIVDVLAQLEPGDAAAETAPESLAGCLHRVMRLVNDLCRRMSENEARGARGRSLRRTNGPSEAADRGASDVAGLLLKRTLGDSPWVRSALALPDSYVSQHALYVIMDPSCPVRDFQTLLLDLRDAIPDLSNMGFAAHVLSEDMFSSGILFPASTDYTTALRRQGRVLLGADMRTAPREPADAQIVDRLRHLSSVWAPVGARRLPRASSGADCGFDAWEPIYGLMNYRLALEKNIFAATLRRTAIEYIRRYGREEETRWLSAFHEMVLQKKAWRPEVLSDLHRFARHLLRAARVEG